MKDERIQHLESKLNEFINTCSMKTTSAPEKMSSCISDVNAPLYPEIKETNTEESDCKKEVIAVEKDDQVKNKNGMDMLLSKDFQKKLILTLLLISSKKLDFLSIMKKKIFTQIKKLE